MIDFNEFCTKTVDVVNKKMNYKYIVELQEFFKINTRYMGLLIRRDDINITPAINLNSLYMEYEQGTPYSDIIDKILKIYDNTRMNENIDVEFLKDYHSVKDLIVFRLVNYSSNKAMLNDKPHRRFLDMAIIYYYEFDLFEIEHCSICVSNSQMQAWDITENMLYEIAMRNTVKIHEPLWFDLQEYIRSIMNKEALAMIGDYNCPCNIYVVTNVQKCFGASTIICSNTLQKIANLVGEDLFIIPSSVHEVLAIPISFLPEDYDYSQLIKSVNVEYLAPEEVLSDTLYYYSIHENQLKIYAKISSIG